MRSEHGLSIGGILMIGLACSALGIAPARAADSTQTTPEPQAAPSEKPASQATMQATTGKVSAAPSTETGTQQAAPSPKPANEATPGTIDASEKKKSAD